MRIKHQIILLLVLLLCGCEDYLEVKPDRSLLVPSTLEDFQALLDNDFQMMNQDVALGFIGSDNYYIPEGSWVSLGTETERNGYIWASEVFRGASSSDWNVPYEQVFIANVVLEGLNDFAVTRETQAEWERIKGSALFFRSYAFYNLLQLFAAPYNENTAANEPGIPLKLSTDLETPISRANLQESYQETINSLLEAITLLPEASVHTLRPDKASAHGFLARIFLSMQDYEKAKEHADACLSLHRELLDYTSLDATSSLPFDQSNEEMLFQSYLLIYGIQYDALVTQELYQLYGPGDLRKDIFFEVDGEDGTITFKGVYSGDRLGRLFSGVATDEVYLIRAESRARLGDIPGAMDDLNTLLKKRWKPGTFVEFTASNKEEALEQILTERRKELAFRGLRWTDLRRLNQEQEYAKTLTRTVNGEVFTLPPNDARYVLPIPLQEIELTGIEQNPR